MRYFNLFIAFCLMAISGVSTTINAVHTVIASGFIAVRKPIAAISLAMILAILLSSCAEIARESIKNLRDDFGTTTWQHQDGYNEQRFYSDKLVCEEYVDERAKDLHPVDGVTLYFVRKHRQQIYDDCFRAKGWQKVTQ